MINNENIELLIDKNISLTEVEALFKNATKEDFKFFTKNQKIYDISNLRDGYQILGSIKENVFYFEGLLVPCKRRPRRTLDEIKDLRPEELTAGEYHQLKKAGLRD